mmetsp:Transcript_106911/g.310341  ORF Transcript_106911/g.310341 Transcript_106911/m.310341 type:complete len:203 (-) Transcript_106911:431-1039(-)
MSSCTSDTASDAAPPTTAFSQKRRSVEALSSLAWVSRPSHDNTDGCWSRSASEMPSPGAPPSTCSITGSGSSSASSSSRSASVIPSLGAPPTSSSNRKVGDSLTVFFELKSLGIDQRRLPLERPPSAPVPSAASAVATADAVASANQLPSDISAAAVGAPPSSAAAGAPPSSAAAGAPPRKTPGAPPSTSTGALAASLVFSS